VAEFELSSGYGKHQKTENFSSKYLRSPVSNYNKKTDAPQGNYDFTKKLDTKAANRENSLVRGHRTSSQN